MKAYKGFKKNNDGTLQCRDFIYEEGKTYETGKIELCRYGFHACTLPTDVFRYYNSDDGNVEFHEVELEGVSEEQCFDSKIVGTKITIGTKITPDEMADLSIDMICSDKEKYFRGTKYYMIRKDNKRNFINAEGKSISEQWFDDCDHFHEGFAGVKHNDKWNFIDENGKLLSEQWFDNVGAFHDGFCRVKLNDKYAFIDTKGNPISTPVQWFDDCRCFCGGFARIKLNGKWNFIDKNGKLLSEQWFDNCWFFVRGYAEVEIDGHYFRLSPEGELSKYRTK